MEGNVNVDNDIARNERLRDLAYQDELREKAEAEGRERARKNRRFVQLYGAGFDRLAWLAHNNMAAQRVYLILAEHLIDKPANSKNLVVISQAIIAEKMGVHIRTVQRAITFLVENNVISRIVLGPGSIYGYGMNPEEVYTNFDYNKKYALFDATVVAATADNPKPEGVP